MTVELVSFYEITTRVESSHLQVSIYARANRNSCEAVNRKGNAEYSEKVIGTAQKKEKNISFCHFCPNKLQSENSIMLLMKLR